MTLATLLLAALVSAGPAAPVAAKTKGPALLDFHAEWCGPCRQVRGAVEELVRNHYPVRSIDIDEKPELAERYRVDRVPTFIVVDGSGRELDRSSGPRSAAALARFFLDAKAKAARDDGPAPDASGPAERNRARDDINDDDDVEDQAGAEAPEADARASDDRGPARPDARRAARPVNPHPARTVVRIKVMAPHSTGYGSGTIIYSTPEESLVLTCAHVFKLEGRKQAAPRNFPYRIVIDLFDGKLRGTSPAQVGYLESVEGRAVDYDFTRDVGLIRIRPGRVLPASRVVPAHWRPKSKPLPMRMLTLGCSEGNDATAWPTKILNPHLRGLNGNPDYEAIECWNAPKQGRSGGGLFTTDFYLAGVCNFAEPRGNHGLYATPDSIYRLLDRNHLAALYAPVRPGASSELLADRNGARPAANAPAARPRRALAPIARAQSPDSDGPEIRRAVDQGELTLPPPALLGIMDPVGPNDPSPIDPAASNPASRSRSTKRVAWRVVPTQPQPAPDARNAPQPTDLKRASGPDTTGPARPHWQLVKPGAAGRAQTQAQRDDRG